MEPILDKARAGQNALERLANAIPGFRGYRERELRRDTDRLQREHLASRLDGNKKALNDLAAAATRGGGSLDVINDVETARKRLDKVANRIRYADRGYSGFFDAVKVDEAMLERIYQFDLQLLEGVEVIRGATEGARTASDAKAALEQVVREIDALDQHLDARGDMLAGVK
jgi:predicted transcriptional regulator